MEKSNMIFRLLLLRLMMMMMWICLAKRLKRKRRLRKSVQLPSRHLQKRKSVSVSCSTDYVAYYVLHLFCEACFYLFAFPFYKYNSFCISMECGVVIFLLLLLDPLMYFIGLIINAFSYFHLSWKIICTNGC